MCSSQLAEVSLPIVVLTMTLKGNHKECKEINLQLNRSQLKQTIKTLTQISQTLQNY